MTNGRTWLDDIGVFRRAAERAWSVVTTPEVRARWREASILPGLTIGGLSAHLFGVLRTTRRFSTGCWRDLPQWIRNSASARPQPPP